MTSGEKGNALTLIPATVVTFVLIVIVGFANWPAIGLVAGHSAFCLASVYFWTRRDARQELDRLSQLSQDVEGGYR
jgi:hypothetical protein